MFMFGFVILTAGILSGTLALRPYIYYLIKIRKPVSRHIPDKITELTLRTEKNYFYDLEVNKDLLSFGFYNELFKWRV